MRLIGINGAVFLIAWGITLWWHPFGWHGPIVAAIPTGITIGQFLTVAQLLALHPRPAPRHWLGALALIFGAALAYYLLELMIEQFWLDRRWVDPYFALVNQLVLLLATVTVGVLLCLLVRVLLWPCHRFLGWRVQWRDQDVSAREARQFSLAEVFCFTTAVALCCTLARALFAATLLTHLIYGTILVLAAWPAALTMMALSRAPVTRGQWALILASVGLLSLAMTPVVPLAHSLGLLNDWRRRFPILQLWSLSPLLVATAFTVAVAITSRWNWLALAGRGLCCRMRP